MLGSCHRGWFIHSSGFIKGLVLVWLLLVSLPGVLPAQGSPLRTVASIPPLGDFLRQIGGPAVQVEVLVAPGQNPHVLNFKPSQLRLLDSAQVLVLNGLGLEFWSEKLVASLENPRLIVVRCGEGLPGSMDHQEIRKNQHKDQAGHREKDPDGGEHEGEAHSDHGGLDPHVWLDPVFAREMVGCVRDGLIRANPEQKTLYQQRAQAYAHRLDALHEEFSRVLAPARGRTIVSFHEGYGHLARRYGLRDLGVVAGFTDMEPTPGRLARVIGEVRRLGVKVIFAEPQFSSRSAQVIGQETGARVAYLDPLGGAEGEGYESMMRRNLAELRKALLE